MHLVHFSDVSPIIFSVFYVSSSTRLIDASICLAESCQLILKRRSHDLEIKQLKLTAGDDIPPEFHYKSAEFKNLERALLM